MKTIYKLAAALLVSATFSSAPNNLAQAKSISIAEMKGEGFRKCKAQGRNGYTAVIRGTTLTSGTATALYGDFSIRSCFKSEKECLRFAKSIPHVVTGVNSIKLSTCRPRN